jgi:hypothetical protein
MEPSELLEYDSCLVNFTQELPFQEGKSLSPIAEEGEDIIDSRCCERGGDLLDIDDSDRFPAFTRNITIRDQLKEFKPVGITKYDGKQDPR